MKTKNNSSPITSHKRRPHQSKSPIPRNHIQRRDNLIAEQTPTPRRAPERKGRSRFLLYLCGAVAVAFVALIFLLRDQIIAPLAVDLNADATVVDTGVAGAAVVDTTIVGRAAQNVGQAIERNQESNASVNADETEAANVAIVEAAKSPSAQLMDTTLAEVNAESNPEGSSANPVIASVDRIDAEGAGASDGSNTIIDTLLASNDEPTQAPTQEQTAIALRPSTSFEINQSVANDKVPNVLFAVRRAEVFNNELVLVAAFENSAEKATRFSRIDAVPLEQIHLLDAAGGFYPAREADPALLAIQPDDGFAPKGANIGRIYFDMPTGAGPFTLRGIHNYPAIEITDAMVASAAPLVAQNDASTLPVPNGDYDIYAEATSSMQELKPLVLHVRTINLTEDSLNLHIGFSNNTLQRFGLLSGPNGRNAWLLDNAQRQYTPDSVSETLRDLITPKQGIAPGEEYEGTLTFPRPSDLTELQFVLEPYAPIIVRFGPNGISEVSSAPQQEAANAATAPSTSSSGVQAYREISTLLDQAASAVLNVEKELYVSSFTSTMQDWHRNVHDRLHKLPLTSFEMELLVPAQLEGIDVQTSDSVSTPNIDVQLKYRLSNISTDNPFVYDFVASFARVDGQWMITKFDPKRNQPFWWITDFSLHDSAHFLIFTRPDSAQNLANLQAEVERSYASLQARGIPLEEKYVAYFTGENDSLYALTGMANTHLVGVALSRYDINGRDIGNGDRTIKAINRAFYVNSEQFALNQAIDANSATLRQSIITHELVHLAFAHSARPFTPPWLSEGIAVYYSEQFVLEDARRYHQQGYFDQINLSNLTGLETLGDHDLVGEATEMRYIYSSAVVNYLIETYGEDMVRTLFRAYASIPADYIEQQMPAEQDASSTRVAFRQMSIELTNGYVATYLGLTLPELDQRVKEWLALQ